MYCLLLVKLAKSISAPLVTCYNIMHCPSCAAWNSGFFYTGAIVFGKPIMALYGGCFCGAVRYAVSGPVFNVTDCHCPTCRRVTGAAAVAWFSIAQDQFSWTAGAPALLRSSERVSRHFCSACGTALGYQHDDSPGELDITVCSLDDPGALAPADHTQTRYRLPWQVIGDSLPRYPGSRAEGPA